MQRPQRAACRAHQHGCLWRHRAAAARCGTAARGGVQLGKGPAGPGCSMQHRQMQGQQRVLAAQPRRLTPLFGALLPAARRWVEH